jgi:hypothetical protein
VTQRVGQRRELVGGRVISGSDADGTGQAIRASDVLQIRMRQIHRLTQIVIQLETVIGIGELASQRIGHRGDQFGIGIARVAGGLGHRRTLGVDVRGAEAVAVKGFLFNVAVGIGDGRLTDETTVESISDLEITGSVGHRLLYRSTVGVIEIGDFAVAVLINDLGEIAESAVSGRRRIARSVVGITSGPTGIYILIVGPAGA